ncbi:MAG: TatD family hydrolase [Oligoflexales bacterium]|nr:TatD family hydrolase [Oligoflexales bacterium]
MNIVDTHCHLTDPFLAADIHKIMESAKSSGIGMFVQGGVNPIEWKRQIEMRSAYPSEIIPCFGIHPWETAKNGPEILNGWLLQLEAMLENASGIGEVGLDFHSEKLKDKRTIQLGLFEKQMELARNNKLPLVLHAVKSHNEIISTIKALGMDPARIIVHGFRGKMEICKKYLNLGATLSIGTWALQAGSNDILSMIPLDLLAVESDAPNARSDKLHLKTPLAILDVASALAGARGTEPDIILQASSDNIRRIFKL